MNTHLSEASVNALLTLVKGANTSGSYADKINILEKAGVLHGCQTYSSRGTRETTVTMEMVEVKSALAKVKVGLTILQKAFQESTYQAAVFAAGVKKALIGRDTSDEFKRIIMKAAAILAGDGGAGAGRVEAYYETADDLLEDGLVPELARLNAYKNTVEAHTGIVFETKNLFEQLSNLIGGKVEDIINEGPNYLSTIPDGTYNFTVNQVNTTQPDIITGTAVITSQKDRYTGRLEQKLINNTIIGAVPITALQTLDAYYNSIQVDTSGSSYNGKYTVTGNTATITSNGYSQAAGEFVETVTTIISTIFSFSFYVINSIINPDKSQTIISLTIYTRQLKSAEVQKAIQDAFDVADGDGDGLITVGEAKKAGATLAARNPVYFQFHADALKPFEHITLEQFNGAFAGMMEREGQN